MKKLRRALSAIAKLPQTAAKLESLADESQTMQILLRSQLDFIRSNSDISDLNSPLTDIMKCHQGIWLPIEESRFPLWMKDGQYQQGLYDGAMAFAKGKAVAVDVGANVGFFSKNMVQDFSLVHAFEPVWFVRACLARNVRGNCIIYPFGLSDQEMDIEIETTPVASGGGQIGGTLALSRYFPIKQQIHTVVLDSLNISNIDFLKIDVQGHELPVLRGAAQTLKRSDAVILCEYVLDGQVNSQIEGELASQDYRLRKRLGKDGIFTR